jgi:acetyltransferase
VSIRNLQYLFRPTSVALIGASPRPASVGHVITRNLLQSGFAGEVMLVNPRRKRIEGTPCYPDAASLPQPPDLAILCVPAPSVPEIVAELGEFGTRAVVVISAGFGESEGTGGGLRQALLEASQPHLLRIVGPNCLGILEPRIGLNASFSHLVPEAGGIAFVAQSGAIVTAVLDWAEGREIGFSHVVSLGDMADVDFGDMLDYLAEDATTQAILLYIEAVTHARKFMSAARAAARMKPVIVVKGGRAEEGARAAASHTGALAGSDEVYAAAFRRAGILRVLSLTELFDAVETLAMARGHRGDRLAILTNGGGLGVLATDALIEEGGRLAELSSDTERRLDEVLPATWSGANPIDIIGDAPGRRYADSLEILTNDPGIDATLVINCPTAVIDREEAAAAVVAAAGKRAGHTVLTSWVGGALTETARQLFAEHRIPTYDTPERAVRAFMHMVDYRTSQDLLIETPPSLPEAFEPEPGRAREVIAKALQAGRAWLTEPEAKEVLAAYGVPTTETRIVSAPEEAASVAARMGGAVVLKILSPEITHKSDVGGVRLDLAGPAVVEEAARQMLEDVGRAHPQVAIAGLTVQPMVRRPGALELIVGAVEDPLFGPIVLFGHGGTAVEVIDDRALGLPPLNMRLAREVISRTRVYRLMRGYRGVRPVNIDAVALTLIKVAQLVIDQPQVMELDVNPLLADEYGVMALDARIRVRETAESGERRLAIRPYPSALEEKVELADGRSLLLRPIMPEDEPALQATFAKLTPDEVRLRFFVPMKTFSHMMAARFTQIDYDREMVLVLTEPGVPGHTEIFAVVQISADPDNERAEYAILVRGDVTGMGLGVFLMRRIIDYARERGIRRIFGDVLPDNVTMLKLCRVLGFTESSPADEPGIVRVSLRLDE